VEASGKHEVNESKTINVPLGMAFLLFADDAMRKRWLKGIDPPSTKATDNKSVRITWPDGSIVLISFHAKARNKTQVTAHQTGLPTAKAAERQRTYWIQQLELLKNTVES
jgi:hypothetical protein